MGRRVKEVKEILSSKNIDFFDRGKFIEVITFEGDIVDFWCFNESFIPRSDNHPASKGLNNLIRYVMKNWWTIYYKIDQSEKEKRYD